MSNQLRDKQHDEKCEPSMFDSPEGFGVLVGSFMLLTTLIFVKFGFVVGLIFVLTFGVICWMALFITNYLKARRKGETRGWALLGAFILTVLMWGG